MVLHCKSYLLVPFDVTPYVNDNTPYDDTVEFRLVKLGPSALFSEAKLYTNSNKHLEKVENLPTASLICQLFSSAGTSEILFRFDSSLTN